MQHELVQGPEVLCGRGRRDLLPRKACSALLGEQSSCWTRRLAAPQDVREYGDGGMLIDHWRGLPVFPLRFQRVCCCLHLMELARVLFACLLPDSAFASFFNVNLLTWVCLHDQCFKSPFNVLSTYIAASR